MIRAGRKFARAALAVMLSFTLSACGAKTETPKTVIKVSGAESAGSGSESTELADDWYGWWKMYDADGTWEDMDGYWWDCCAKIAESSGAASLLIWDEDLGKDNWLAEISAVSTDGGLSCAGGTLMSEHIGADECTLSLSEDEGTLLTIEGRYESEKYGNFSYAMYLRPWGDEWSGDEDELPYYYESWYLPLIESGQGMPDTIGE